MNSMKKPQREGVNGQRKLSQLETLKCYENFKDFRKYMYRGIDKMPRWIKVSEGMECIKSIKICVRYLSRVARSRDRNTKIMYIDSFLDEWDVIFDSISFFYEVKGISSHQRDVMLRFRYVLEEQITAFRVWLINVTPSGSPKDVPVMLYSGIKSKEGGVL